MREITERPLVRRGVQVTFLFSFLALCWLAFLAIHEFGHVVAAWITGGTVSYVVLHPLRLSMTVLDVNPHPACVGWGGPLLGVMIPFVCYAVALLLRWNQSYLLRFFCGFCCVGNGSYLLVDAFAQSGDGATLVHAGTSRWMLVLFGLVVTPVGFALWNGQSRHFGLGPRARSIEPREAAIALVLLVAVVAIEFAESPI